MMTLKTLIEIKELQERAAILHDAASRVHAPHAVARLQDTALARVIEAERLCDA